MILRYTIKGLRLSFSMSRVNEVIGVNSMVGDGFHIPMFDFDNTDLETVSNALSVIQIRYGLSDIYILETKPDSNYIAYCFTALPLLKVIEIVAATHGIDFYFLKYGVYREKFTLRITPKGDRSIKLVRVIPGFRLSNCEVEDLHRYVKYETLRRP